MNNLDVKCRPNYITIDYVTRQEIETIQKKTTQNVTRQRNCFQSYHRPFLKSSAFQACAQIFQFLFQKTALYFEFCNRIVENALCLKISTSTGRMRPG